MGGQTHGQFGTAGGVAAPAPCWRLGLCPAGGGRCPALPPRRAADPSAGAAAGPSSLPKATLAVPESRRPRPLRGPGGPELRDVAPDGPPPARGLPARGRPAGPGGRKARSASPPGPGAGSWSRPSAPLRAGTRPAPGAGQQASLPRAARLEAVARWPAPLPPSAGFPPLLRERRAEKKGGAGSSEAAEQAGAGPECCGSQAPASPTLRGKGPPAAPGSGRPWAPRVLRAPPADRGRRPHRPAQAGA